MTNVNRHHLSLSLFSYNSMILKIQMLAKNSELYINMKLGKYLEILKLLFWSRHKPTFVKNPDRRKVSDLIKKNVRMKTSLYFRLRLIYYHSLTPYLIQNLSLLTPLQRFGWSTELQSKIWSRHHGFEKENWTIDFRGGTTAKP